MTNAVIPFDFSAPAPQAPRRRESSLNQELMSSRGFPVISIKGKVWAIVKDNERRVLTRVIDDEQVPVASLNLAVIRANAKARHFYGKQYVEGDSEGVKPVCWSFDGVTPDASVDEPQHDKCQLCPHSQWGTKISTDGSAGKGTACTVNTRLAVAVPTAMDTVYLLRVPAGSRANFSEAVRAADAHGKDYNEVSMRISFDQDAPSPKLVFRPTGLLSDEAYAKVQELYDDQLVKDIIGSPSVRVAQEVPHSLPAPAAKKALPAPAVEEDELGAALAGTPAPAPAPARRAAAKTAKPAPAPADSGDLGSLLGALSEMIGSGATDD